MDLHTRKIQIESLYALGEANEFRKHRRSNEGENSIDTKDRERQQIRSRIEGEL